LGHRFINQKLLVSATKKYNGEIEAFAAKHQLSCEWVEKGVRKEEFVIKYRERAGKKNILGVYYILKSKENESTFRVASESKLEPLYRRLDSDLSDIQDYLSGKQAA
jgi:hypothetical protein